MSEDRTEAQQEASRKNGAQSKGPKTAGGKAIAAMNAAKHGYTSTINAVKLIPGDNRGEFDLYHQALTERFQPRTTAERYLVRDLTAAGYRLRSINDVQAKMLCMQTSDASPFVDDFGKYARYDPDICVPFGVVRMANASNGFTLLMRYAASLQRQYAAILKELTDLLKTPAMRNEPENRDKPLTNQSHTDQEAPALTVLWHPVPSTDPPITTPETLTNM